MSSARGSSPAVRDASTNQRRRRRRPARISCRCSSSRSAYIRRSHLSGIRRLGSSQGRQGSAPARLLQPEQGPGDRHSDRPEQPDRARRSRSRAADAFRARAGNTACSRSSPEGFRQQALYVDARRQRSEAAVTGWKNPPYWIDFYQNTANGNEPPVVKVRRGRSDAAGARRGASCRR